MLGSGDEGNECVRDSGIMFAKDMNRNASYYNFFNKFRKRNDASKSIVCSSISSRASTESYLL